MMHKYVFETLDRSLQDIMGNKILFGGITVLFGGDFRQLLPVIRNGTPETILNASIKRSYIWRNLTDIFELHVILRLQTLKGVENIKQLRSLLKPEIIFYLYSPIKNDQARAFMYNIIFISVV